MRILVLGGTRFIGRALVFELLGAGHTVAVAHRGEHAGDLPPSVQHIHSERRQLAAHREELARFSPDAVIDLSAMTVADVAALEPAIDRSLPLVAVSSMDVYRAFASVYDGTVTDAVPLTEEAPLRTVPSPDRDFVPPGWGHEPGVYEKLDVERLHRERGATICRLPMVYGEHDYNRREDFVLARVRAGDREIPFGPGTFLCSRGYAPEIARGLRLACERGGRGEVFNLCERECATVRHWAEEILAAAGHEAELVRVPDEELPEDFGLSAEIPQSLLCGPSRAERELGWVHAPWRGCVARSVRWHLAHPRL
ncbi:MAG TPA: NAD-dependent epimerase/dehydratase family protein [Solirubrobacterales bacterium]|nr:NAD-dependent epimerase/dehydratase family protein [Solirubrobacterales bacterium]